jgi:hypothetical protein
VITWDEFVERLQDRFADWPTPEIVLFEIAVIVAGIVTWRFLSVRVERAWRHLVLIAVGMFLIEFFTGPMWITEHLGFWAYVYSDVSWILTIGWVILISLSIYLVEHVLHVTGALRRYLLFLVFMTPAALLYESLGKAIGVRSYAPETIAAAGPETIPVLDVPAAGLYYVPVVMTLVWSFYKHWLPSVEPGATAPGRLPILTRLVLTAVAVLMFEIVVEPMATNQGFPDWSYLYHDITVVMTGLWVVIVTVVMIVVDLLMPKADWRLRFAAYLVLITLIAAPLEAWFLNNGYRIYGPSATADFIGLRTVVLDLPIEVFAAIPMYLGLVVSFVRYWDGSTDRTLGFTARVSMKQGEPGTSVAPPVPGGA